MFEKRFSKIKKDGVYYVRDNKLDTSFPINELVGFPEELCTSEAIDDLVERLNQEDTNINRGG